MSPSLPRYIARRLLQSIPLILGILIFSFVLIQLAPGDPIMLLAGEGGDADYYATMRAYYGLDRPLPEQLLRYVGAILRGDFGYSFNYRQPVFDVILGRLPATLLLMGSALIFALTVGVGLGIISALRPRSLLDRSISVMTLTFTALPVFWLGQLLLMLFAARLRLFPVHGMVSVRADYTGLRHLLDLLHHLVLPTIALGLLQLALLTRLTRTSLREQLAEDYVRSARAKGLQERIVVLRHAMRNAMLPVITIIGSHVGTLITGAGERPGVRAIRGNPRV
ncbi:MAG: ABC transporter permease [Candidatus Viridilinea halotolerans]|uniref:ABC transporter permease n=1 Tax=Candidatus Viridilinea halotolerans TaxID=2491704 RepID=A0A426TQT7_9CHLR|nr:MAG: ABC transporter permease [Candidatus Viridilinea halotolerans]